MLRWTTGLKNMTVPVGYCFGTQDPVFQDYFESNIYGIMNTCGSRTIFLYKEITEPTGDEEPGFLLKTMMKAAAKLKGVKA